MTKEIFSEMPKYRWTKAAIVARLASLFHDVDGYDEKEESNG